MRAEEVVGLRRFEMRREDRVLLDPTELSLAAGERLLITGPSGCGKSTLLRRLCALDPGSEEQVWLHGVPVSRWQMPKLRRTIAYLPQTPMMLEGSVRDNLRLALSLKVYKGVELDDDRLYEVLASLNLALDLNDDALRLSPGQQARVSLLQRLLLEPEVLLCDEPVASLDPDNAKLVAQALGRAGESGMVQVIVSHQPLDGLSGRRYRFHECRLELMP